MAGEVVRTPDLSDLIRSPERVLAAKTTLDELAETARQAMDEHGSLAAFTMLAAGNEDMQVGELADALALAALRLAAQ